MAMLAPEGASAVLSWGGDDLLRARQASNKVELDWLWLIFWWLSRRQQLREKLLIRLVAASRPCAPAPPPDAVQGARAGFRAAFADEEWGSCILTAKPSL